MSKTKHSLVENENPEWTQKDIDNALRLEEMPSQLQSLVLESKAKKRGRPISNDKKVSVTIRYSASVIEAFKATGKGWQTRMNQVLEDYISQH
ncbi:BrnA antitoxin family protein [Mannheimia sp. AT1]|uniref:BrnA antitoxin family protein n=1 Tax=Mannheimia cairinae TaxID=3025936 RepID=A0ABT5MR36_9PAST|nr:BrnA antitoxin family protein [Mannheimia cairinae]MDD0824462.1 BrnA antitoxin family protein [Mannheimia cairinae]MDD0825563.1 BrnA antitoxin family protein [Mannheimia cairinae]